MTGGVTSSLGKGIACASIGRMLKSRGFGVSILKLDPYLNVDPGTMSPLEHGEVFVTSDGCETDLDLGHYERFLNQDLTVLSNVTAGQVYNELLEKERRGDDYLGETIQVVPHFVHTVAGRIRKLAETTAADIVIVEVGGTVGDMEAEAFIEAIRWMCDMEGRENTFCLHLAFVPLLKPTNELKTKPTQHSVRQLRGMGIQPDAILCRLNDPTESDEQTKSLKEKISLHCGVPTDAIIYLPTLDNVYAVPMWFEQQGLARVIAKKLNLPEIEPNVPPVWEALSRRHPPQVRIPTRDEIDGGHQGEDLENVRIAIVGKYTSLHDSYLSVVEALRHSEIDQNVKVDILWVPAELIEHDGAEKHLALAQGIVVPGGFDKRGTEGMIEAARFARERSVPYLGLCIGLQIMIIEFARHVAGKEDASSVEFEPDTSYPVIDMMEEQKGISQSGGTMRLGLYDCVLVPGTIAHASYAPESGSKKGEAFTISERHRHRYEYNNRYRADLEPLGLVSSGINPDLALVEMAEVADHPFMLGSQFHPEFKSRPERPHPLFNALIHASRKFEREGTQRSLLSKVAPSVT